MVVHERTNFLWGAVVADVDDYCVIANPEFVAFDDDGNPAQEPIIEDAEGLE